MGWGAVAPFDANAGKSKFCGGFSHPFSAGCRPGMVTAMVKLTVMYPWHEGFRFDMDYYTQKHIAIHKQDPNVLGIIIEEGRSAFRGGSTPEMVCVAHFFYESIGKLNESRTPEKGRRQLADIPNFTDITPQDQISEVEYLDLSAFGVPSGLGRG